MKHFHLGAVSGTIANATTGIVFAWRAATYQYIQRVRFKVGPITPASAVGFLSLELATQAVMSTNYTGGTDLSDQTGAGAANYAITARIRDVQRVLASSQIPVSGAAAGNIRIASTAALGGGGGGTAATQPFTHGSVVLPNSGASSLLVLEWDNPTKGLEHEDPSQGCLALAPDTGFVVRVPVNAAAALTLELSAEVEWLE